MKKRYIIVIMLLAVIGKTTAQGNIEFRATGGYFLGSANVSLGEFDFDIANGSGFYIGVLTDIEILEKFHVQPELLYANIVGNGSLVVPLMAKYYIVKSFNIQAGPQLDYLLDTPSNIEGFVKDFGISIAVGAAYDLTKRISIQGKYTFGLNERLDIPSSFLGGVVNTNVSLKADSFQIGLTYKL